MEPACSSPTCPKPGTLRCAGCKNTHYCGKECQKSAWKTHKLTCTKAQKHNCFIIRALPKSDALPVFNQVPEQIEPLHLQNYGTEGAEMRELTARLGWDSAVEVGKFYDHAGSDGWYYFVYGEGGSAGEKGRRLRNELSDLLCYQVVYGDITVVRSGPADGVYPEEFTHGELCKAVEFYKNEDRASVFAQRERSRMMRKWGMGSSGASPHMP
ncbi:hypothetical protein MMC30_006443 [Trapelia coarctata]|nr:hypothetical protein [Trapelia coarctata]